MRQRYSYHHHSVTGTWYCFDHMTGQACSKGFVTPFAALAECKVLEREWVRLSAKIRRQEMSPVT